MNVRKTAAIIFAILSLAAASFAIESPKDALLKKSNPEIVAKVGDSTISRKELDQALKSLSARKGAEMTPDSIKQAEPSVLDQLIAAEVLFTEAKKLDLKDIDKQVDFRIAQGKAKFQTLAEYEEAIKSSGLNEKELMALVRKDTIINQFVEKVVVSKINITEEDAKKFYDANTQQFQKESEIKASHILLGVDSSASDEDKKKAKEKAEQVLKEFKSGKSFEELAKSYSTCPSKEQGGDLGFFGKGRMVKAFEDAAFGLKKDEVSGVVETQFGYHIIKVTDKKEAETVPFEEVKAKLTDYLKGQQVQKNVTAFIQEKLKNVKVEKYLK